MASKEQKEEYQDCFTLHDKDGNGRVPIQSLGSVVRSLGITPTEETIHRIARNQIRKDTFTFNDLLQVMDTLKREPEFTEDDFRESFKVFDRDGNGYVSAAELRHVMTNLGEKLTDDEVDEMLQAFDMDRDGQLNYEDMVNMMINQGEVRS